MITAMLLMLGASPASPTDPSTAARVIGEPRLAAPVGRAGVTLTPSAINPNPAVYGQPVIFNVTVTATPPASSTPTGTVTVFMEGGSGCGHTLPSTHCQLSPMWVGTRSVTYHYPGDALFEPATATRSLTVERAGTAFDEIRVTPTPSVAGQPVTVSWVLSVTEPGGGAPTGMVQASASPTESCTAAAQSATSCQMVFTEAGIRSLTLAYLGSSHHAPSSANVPHPVTDTERVFRDGFEGSN